MRKYACHKPTATWFLARLARTRTHSPSRIASQNTSPRSALGGWLTSSYIPALYTYFFEFHRIAVDLDYFSFARHFRNVGSQNAVRCIYHLKPLSARLSDCIWVQPRPEKGVALAREVISTRPLSISWSNQIRIHCNVACGFGRCTRPPYTRRSALRVAPLRQQTPQQTRIETEHAQCPNHTSLTHLFSITNRVFCPVSFRFADAVSGAVASCDRSGPLH